MLPNNVVFGMFVQMEVMNKHSKGEYFPDVVAVDNGVLVDLSDPSIIFKALEQLPIISPRGYKDKLFNILSLRPRSHGEAQNVVLAPLTTVIVQYTITY